MLRYFTFLILFSVGYYGSLSAQSVPSNTRVILLNDGSKFKGKIVEAVPGESVSVMLKGGQILKIYQSDIKKIKLNGAPQPKTKFGKKKGEIIFLKDGGNLYGKIIEQVPNDYVILKLKNDDEVTFFAEEISRIKYNKRPRRDFYDKPTGFYHEVDVGGIGGKESTAWGNTVNFSAHTINSYRFKPWLQTGLGVGLEFQPNFHIVPFYLSVGGDLGRSRVVPLYFMHVGHSYARERKVEEFEVFNDVDGGKYLHVGSGVKVKLSKTVVTMKMGYKFSDIKTVNTFTDGFGRDSWDATVKRQIRRFTVTVGIGF